MAGVEKRFSKLTLIKIFYRSIIMDERHYVISMIFIEKACGRDVDLHRIVNVFAAEKARRKTF